MLIKLTAFSIMCGEMTTTPSQSATMMSPGFMTTLRPAAVSMAIGVLTEATRVKEPCPRVDCPIANTYGKAAIRHLVLRIRTERRRLTGKPKRRCSAISRQRPLIMTPFRPRDLAPALIRPPHTALTQSERRCRCSGYEKDKDILP